MESSSPFAALIGFDTVFFGLICIIMGAIIWRRKNGASDPAATASSKRPAPERAGKSVSVKHVFAVVGIVALTVCAGVAVIGHFSADSQEDALPYVRWKSPSNEDSASGGEAEGRVYKTITYENGDVYEGETLNGKPDGTGTMRYSGENDYGADPMVLSGTYQGEWENGMRNGTGTMVWDAGITYEGEWKDDRKHGHGVQNNYDTITFEGNWVDDVKEGSFTETYNDGNVYQVVYEAGISVSEEQISVGTWSWPEPSGGGNSSSSGSGSSSGTSSTGSGSTTVKPLSGPVLPDFQSFSGNSLQLYSETSSGGYTELIYYQKGQYETFIREYLSLLTNSYHFSLRDSYTIESVRSDRYVYDYTGSGSVGTFSMDERNLDSDNISLYIWVLGVAAPEVTEIHIRYADGLTYGDTGNRTTQSLEKMVDSSSSDSGSSGGSGSIVDSSNWSSADNRVKVRCIKCGGNGRVRCSNCDGLGYKEVRVSTPNYSGKSDGIKYGTSKQTCIKCSGRGSIECSNCHGEGRV